MIHTVVENNNLNINLLDLTKSRGYSITSDTFEHIKGYEDRDIIIKDYPISQGKTYTITFTLDNTDATTSLTYSLGGVASEELTSDAYIQDTITATTNEYLTFKGSGNFKVKELTVMVQSVDVQSNSEDTITFSQERNKWITYKSIVPDCGFTMYTHLYTYKNGHLFKHSWDATPNNFYGKQYFSLIKFPISSVGVKTYNSLSIHANKKLSTTEDGIKTQLGQVSDLFQDDFQVREGVQAGVFFRDKVTGLLDGDLLKGRWVEIELTDEDTKTENLELFRVVVKSNVSTPNE